MATTYRAQRARASLSESVLWVVVDDAYEVHRVATDFCLALDGANRAANTVRAYAGYDSLIQDRCDGLIQDHLLSDRCVVTV
ncbi:hypothetical protein H7J52_27480 [Mycobacterium gordonae]|uniref:hypothetical protein n=1 Tax=Mycobacterium gordonae TaxID=1778 RepID=UPI0021F29C7F|nr:hypothetical protein [Mycobacterium gordonae]MCV7009478.1 hypothetical protein [Mycobacterium gordonae]